MLELDNLNFTTREEYFTWREIWRKEYNNISLQIRNIKQKRNDTFRRNEYAGTFQNLLLRFESNALSMIELRMLSKKKAGEQREKNRFVMAA